MSKIIKYTVLFLLYEIVLFSLNLLLIQLLGLGSTLDAAGDFSKSLPNTQATVIYTLIQAAWIFASLAGVIVYTLLLITVVFKRKK